jgi:hypothetical protein
VGVLVCYACGAEVTDEEAAIEVCGLHRHTTTNPAGHGFVIRCFVAARGVTVVTNPSSEWSWFPGWRWQIEHCETCDAHLGWKFVRADGSFHAFVDERLRPASSSG